MVKLGKDKNPIDAGSLYIDRSNSKSLTSHKFGKLSAATMGRNARKTVHLVHTDTLLLIILTCILHTTTPTLKSFNIWEIATYDELMNYCPSWHEAILIGCVDHFNGSSVGR